MGLNPLLALIEGDEHHEVCHPVQCQIMGPQPKVAKEPLHKRMHGDPEASEMEGDEGDDLRFPWRGFCHPWVQQIPPSGRKDQPRSGHL